jgi:hypothetical protein
MREMATPDRGCFGPAERPARGQDRRGCGGPSPTPRSCWSSYTGGLPICSAIRNRSDVRLADRLAAVMIPSARRDRSGRSFSSWSRISCIPHDAGELVVEVMGDTAGELTDGFDLLGLA